MSGPDEREPGGGVAAAAAAAGPLLLGDAVAAAAAAGGGPEEPGAPLGVGAGVGGGGRQGQPEPGGDRDSDAPPKKRLKLPGGAEGGSGGVKLEERLYSVLCCTVCLDLPKASVYQCTNGHLMCAGCFIHLLADARLKEEQATCPNCRCEISKSLCCRNLAVEKAVSELPSECGFCLRQFPRSLLERHQKEECQDRVIQCKYKRIGCPWQGPYHELTVHEAECTHPTKTGNELMEILDEMDQTHKREMQLYNSIFGLLSFEKIGYTERVSSDIIRSPTQPRLEPQRTPEVCFLAKLKKALIRALKKASKMESAGKLRLRRKVTSCRLCRRLPGPGAGTGLGGRTSRPRRTSWCCQVSLPCPPNTALWEHRRSHPCPQRAALCP